MRRFNEELFWVSCGNLAVAPFLAPADLPPMAWELMDYYEICHRNFMDVKYDKQV